MFHASRAKAKDWQLDRVVINACCQQLREGLAVGLVALKGLRNHFLQL